MSDVNNSGNSGENNVGKNLDVQSLDDGVVNSSDVVGNGGTPEKNNVPKTFTQEEVNSIVQNRLKKEKDSFSLERDSLSGELEVYKKYVESYVEDVISSYDIAVVDLLKKLPIIEQLDWIQKNKDNLSAQNTTTVPETPQTQQKQTFKPSKTKFRL